MIRQWLGGDYRFLLRVCGAVLILSLTSAQAQIFPSNLSDRQWLFSASPFECQLENKVNGFGVIFIRAEAGGKEFVFLKPDVFSKDHRSIKLKLESPPWQNKMLSEELGDWTLSANTYLNLPIEASYVVEKLQQGLQFVIQVTRKQKEMALIQVPALGFRQTAADFYLCYSRLLKLNHDQAKESILYYSTAQFHLNADQKDYLNHLSAYIKALLKVSKNTIKVVIDAHSDTIGDELPNLELSRLRALQIQKYLLKKGVSKDIFKVRFHGERYPASSQKQSKNRRVKITLTGR